MANGKNHLGDVARHVLQVLSAISRSHGNLASSLGQSLTVSDKYTVIFMEFSLYVKRLLCVDLTSTWTV